MPLYLFGNVLFSEGVRQGMLETVVPKIQNAAVMIVAGKKHRGQVTYMYTALCNENNLFFEAV